MVQKRLFQEPMKVISLHNPWACLMAGEEKTVETRGWKIEHEGWLAIHASKGFDPEEKELCQEQPFADALHKSGYHTLREIMATGGHVICIVELYAIELMTLESIEKQRKANEKEIHFGAWEPGRYAWRTRNVKRLDPPVPLRGMQKLFTWPEGNKVCGF